MFQISRNFDFLEYLKYGKEQFSRSMDPRFSRSKNDSTFKSLFFLLLDSFFVVYRFSSTFIRLQKKCRSSQSISIYSRNKVAHYCYVFQQANEKMERRGRRVVKPPKKACQENLDFLSCKQSKGSFRFCPLCFCCSKLSNV